MSPLAAYIHVRRSLMRMFTMFTTVTLSTVQATFHFVQLLRGHDHRLERPARYACDALLTREAAVERPDVWRYSAGQNLLLWQKLLLVLNIHLRGRKARTRMFHVRRNHYFFYSSPQYIRNMSTTCRSRSVSIYPSIPKRSPVVVMLSMRACCLRMH